MQQNDELRPCPFCGGEATFLKQRFVHIEPLYSVTCKKCGANTMFYPTLFDAEKRWNKRCSGVADKNGKLIFTGDRVDGMFLFGMQVTGVCDFRNGAFGLRWNRGNVEEFTPFVSMCNIELEIVEKEKNDGNL